MPTQYYMRAYHTGLSTYVDWIVNDAPDSTGAFSGYSSGLVNITVNRIVQSKILNFLKPNEALGGSDGYYFHLNSYDWRNVTTPLNTPPQVTGLAVERGATSGTAVTAATNATPIRITSAGHGLLTGQLATITGVQGNLAANGTFYVTKFDNNNFDLNGTTGGGTYTGGGTVYTPRDFSTLTWDENSQYWRFVFNTLGDGITLGASQQLRFSNALIDGYIALGADPADAGAIRLSNNTFIASEANPTGTDIQLIGADNLNRIKLGSVVGDLVYIPGAAIIDGYIVHDGTGTNVATTGFIREQNATTIIAFRNQAQNGDIVALSTTSGNLITLGDAVNLGLRFNTSTANVHQFQVNSVASLEIGSTFARFVTGVIAPTIFQVDNTTPSSVGSTLTVQAQNATGTTSTGGTVQLTSGTGTPNDGNAGNVNLNTGGVTKLVVSPTITTSSNADVVFSTAGTRAGLATTTIAAGSNGASLPQGTINVASTLGTSVLPAFPSFGVINIITSAGLQTVYYTGTTGTTFTGCSGGTGTMSTGGAISSAPFITQNGINTASTKAQTLTIQSQNNIGTTSTGGDLVLSSGTGTSQSGNTLIQTGGTNQIIVSPINLPALSFPTTTGKVIITGNLEVQGTTTTVDSTVIDIIGRVIHANWADPAISPNVAVPNQITGYSIHRGNISGVPRDGASWIWTEGAQNNGSDGYWRAVTIPGDGYSVDGYTIANVLNPVGVMSSNFSASPDPNAVSGTLPGTGSLRSVNNTPAVAARNVTPTTTLTATGLTNGSASLPLGTITVTSTTGFTTPSGSLLILSSAGQQVVTYTGTTGTSFTGATGGTGTIVTGGIVAQTNNSTTTTGSQTLPLGTINVTSTVGFPTSGTIRIVTTGGVQTVTYTGTGATTFTGVSGGVGTAGPGSLVSSLPITGNNDLVLLGTDFGNRILHGAPTINTGHIFNTPTGFLYDFQVNSVPQVRIQAGDPDGDGYAESIEVQPTVSNPRIYQLVQPNAGANAGFSMMLQAQNGQQQTGATTNNNGGNLILASGAAGTGGTTAVGFNGSVDIQSNTEIKARFFPTFAAVAANSNTMLIEESIIRIGPTQNVPRVRQDSTTNASGQSFSLQAQNAATTGGPLLLQSGTGATNDGYINLITGATTKMTVFPTTAVSAADNNSILFFENLFRVDTAQVTPLIRQDDKTANGGTGETFTVQAQNETGTTSTGGALTLKGGSGTSTGGAINIQSGAGGVTNGVINMLIGGTQAIAFNNVDSDASGFSEVIGIASTITAPRMYQIATGGATGTILAIMAQNAATTGGPLQLHSGTGATNDGYINLTTGSTVKVTVYPTTATVAANNNSILFFENKLRFDTAQVTPLIRQDDKTANGGTGETFTVQAQNETGTTSNGGDLNLTSGTGTSLDGYLNLQAGGSTVVKVHTNKVSFLKGWRRHVTNVTTTYQVLVTDDYLAVTALAAPYTITLPASPIAGDTYTIKDTTGNAGTSTLTIAGNGNNIDGSASYVINQAYAAATFTFAGGQWSVS